MSFRYLILLVFLILLLAACTGTGATQTGELPEYPAAITPGISAPTNLPTAYPPPVLFTPAPTSSASPEPTKPPTGSPTPPVFGYEPQADDGKLDRNPVFLSLADSGLVITKSQPVQVSVSLVGDMPSPCHQLRVVVTRDNTGSAINLEVYTLVEPGVNCIMVLKPFEAMIPLGSFPAGHYAVHVNGELLGEFDG